MDALFLHFVTAFMAFFAIMNPIANTPVFLGLTEGVSSVHRVEIAQRAVIQSFIIVLAFAVAGKMIFGLFGLNMDAFRITGGCLVFLIGINMLQGRHSRMHYPHSLDNAIPNDASEDDPATFPLAMPMLAGPGTITTAMNLSADGGLVNISFIILAFGLLCLITYLLFIFGERFIRYIGRAAMGVITRLMGLIVAVIGTGMVIEGIKNAFALGVNG
ncbi:MarC family protein [Shewanella sp. YIC-542]|uniref:MarC family protein n=1 Tax=Shewanella mytili TaxID=3377111 RepID=UPI00398EB5C9